jgi:predicted ferric reductase
MNKKSIGNFIVVALVITNLALWLIFSPVNDGRETYFSQWFGEMMSTSALILMSCGILLSTRPRWLEPFFGGLDQMYQSHKKIAIIAISLIFIHFFFVSIGRGVHLGVSLGKIAFTGLSISVLLALAPSIPFVGGYIRLRYHHWKLVHKFAGLFLIVGILHSFRVDNLMHTTPVVNAYVRSISFAGAGIYLYKELLQGWIKRKRPYRVEEVKRLNGTVLEISLRALKDSLSFRAGQFLFISFTGDRNLGEAHPFTISSSPRSDHLVLAVKNSGDYTHYLYDHLQAGGEARIEGGYGMFNYKSGSREQVWIAGGIGITPFLSWIRDFDEPFDREVHFFYAVRSPEEVLYLDEIERAQAIHPNFKAHLHHSNRDGRLTADQIVAVSGPPEGKDIYICGPIAMTEALKAQFVKHAVQLRCIHYEEFNFR